MIYFSKVSKAYKKDFFVLKELNLQVKPAQSLIIQGDSGTGKTTILKLIYAEELPTTGHVFVMGKDTYNLTKVEISLLRRRIGIIPQDLLLLDRNTFENIALACYILNLPYPEIYCRVMKALNRIDLIQKRHININYLSREDKYKVVFARAIVNNPSILLIDEPPYEEYPWLVKLLKEFNTIGTTLIITSRYSSLTNILSNTQIINL
jgi:cell division transport system ATP-binding protein